MFRKNYNRAVLQVRLETQGPLLIRAGDSGLNPVAADLACVRTQHAVHGLTVYVPGSSLKGALRSGIEARLRAFAFGDNREGSCNPLEHKNSCADLNRREKESPTIHRKHCLACRTFGSLSMQGRASIRDLFPWSKDENLVLGVSRENTARANKVEVRQNVSINRISNAVQHGPFDMEVIPPGVIFHGEIALQNYQAWQLGLIALAREEFNDGVALLGSTKSRGFGAVKMDIVSILHEQVAQPGKGAGNGATSSPLGVGSLATAEEVREYGLLTEVALPSSVAEIRGLSTRYHVKDEAQIQQWLEVGMEAVGALLENAKARTMPPKGDQR